MGQSVVNPKGYGTPIVGLFNNNGAMLSYGGLLKDSVTGEHTLIISKCTLEDNEEDGITCNITIESTSINLIDSQVFNHGNTLMVKFGYLQEGKVGFGVPYYLIVKDYRINYSEMISYDIELVDEKTFTSLSKPESNEIIDETRKAILEAEGEELDVNQFEEALSKESKQELRDVFKQLNTVRNNFKERSGEYVYHYKGHNYATWDDLNAYLRRSSTVRDNEFYKIRTMTPEQRSKEYQVRISDLNWLGRTNVKIGQFLNGNRGRGIKGYYRDWFKPLKDLYGFSIPTREGRHKWLNIKLLPEGYIPYRLWEKKKADPQTVEEHKKFAEQLKKSGGSDKWIEELKKSGFMFYATEGYTKSLSSVLYEYPNKLPLSYLLTNPIKALSFDNRGNLNEKAIDEIIDILISDATLARVEADMNLSNYNNLEKYLRSLIGGPHIITDKGDGNGVVVKTRDLDAAPYMALHYKGGTGDLLEVSIDTDFNEPEYVESETMTIDPETGEMIAVTDITHNQVAGSTSGTRGYVNAAMEAVANGTQMPDKQSFFRQELPGVNYHTESPAYLSEQTSFFTSAVDNTRFSRVLPGTYFDVKPDPIEDIIAEVENRKGDLNLKRIIADASLLGNPSLRSGMNFYLGGIANRFTGKYYGLSVTHSLDAKNGYTTKLELAKIPDIDTSAKQVTRQREEVKDGERRWVYSKAKLVEFNENNNYTGRSYAAEPIGSPGEKVLFTDPRFGVSGFYNAETGGVWPTGVQPTQLRDVIQESRKAYEAESRKLRDMSYDPAASINDDEKEARTQFFKVRPPETIIKQRKPNYNE
jgi:hypothetical protein